MTDERCAQEDPGWVEIWREHPNDFYAPFAELHAELGALRICVGGYVITAPIRQWHETFKYLTPKALKLA